MQMKFKTVATFTFQMIVLLFEIRRNKIKNKVSYLEDFQKAFNLYNEVIKGWMLKSAKLAITSVF